MQETEATTITSRRVSRARWRCCEAGRSPRCAMSLLDVRVSAAMYASAGSSRSRRRKTPPRSGGRTRGTQPRAGRPGSVWREDQGRAFQLIDDLSDGVGLPDPVTPSRVCSRLPWRMLSAGRRWPAAGRRQARSGGELKIGHRSSVGRARPPASPAANLSRTLDTPDRRHPDLPASARPVRPGYLRSRPYGRPAPPSYAAELP